MDVRLNGIPRGEVLRYLGLRGAVPEDVSGDLDRAAGGRPAPGGLAAVRA